MIKIQNNIPTRESIPHFLVGLAPESLADLRWTDPALGVSTFKWLPEVDQSPALKQYERHGAETLTLGSGVVVVTRAVVPWSASEIAAALASVKADLSKQIDAAVLAVYAKPVALSKEYEAREAAATAYKAAGYPVTVPEWISDFATPAGLTATAATDLILVQAAQMRGTLQPLGKLRMQKNAVQRATTEAGARAIHATAMAQIAVIATSLI